MSVGYGFGMLAVGMTVILIAGLIIYFVINKIERDEKLEQEQKERNKIYGN
jgi:heme exporter protein D|tara:strand:- start:163 stop:315 length:153 start_codon:yes stop_codon:yes gene_type:complete